MHTLLSGTKKFDAKQKNKGKGKGKNKSSLSKDFVVIDGVVVGACCWYVFCSCRSFDS